MIEVMEPSGTVTQCPYKGSAEYFGANRRGPFWNILCGRTRDPIDECPRMASYICFFNERVDDIFVDGEAIENVVSPWSQPAEQLAD